MKVEFTSKISNSVYECELNLISKYINPFSEENNGVLNIKLKSGFMIKQIIIRLVKYENVSFNTIIGVQEESKSDAKSFSSYDKLTVWEKLIPLKEINPSNVDTFPFAFKLGPKYPPSFKYKKNNFVSEIIYQLESVIESQDLNPSINLVLPVEIQSSEYYLGQKQMRCETQVETGIVCRNKGDFIFEIVGKTPSININRQEAYGFLLNNLNSSENILLIKCSLIEIIEGKGKSAIHSYERVNQDTTILSSWSIEGVKAKEKKLLECKFIFPQDKSNENLGSSKGKYAIRSYCLIIEPIYQNYTFCVKNQIKCPIYLANNNDPNLINKIKKNLHSPLEESPSTIIIYTEQMQSP